VAQARQALFRGEDLQKILDTLLGLQKYPGLLCQSTFSCDEYYYLLGLTNELLGNERAAIDAFLQLWRDYSKSPFTTLARLKLARSIEPPTETPTATLTAYPTGLLTPGATLFPTLTPRPIGSVTPGATPTATTPGGVQPTPTTGAYPYPGITPEPTDPVIYP